MTLPRLHRVASPASPGLSSKELRRLRLRLRPVKSSWIRSVGWVRLRYADDSIIGDAAWKVKGYGIILIETKAGNLYAALARPTTYAAMLRRKTSPGRIANRQVFHGKAPGAKMEES